MERVYCECMDFRRKSRNFDPTTVECCSTVDWSAEDTQERCRARPETCLDDVVQDQLLLWRKDVSRRELASVEEGHDVERVAETMRVNDERVVLRRESWRRTQRAKAGDARSRPLRGDDACWNSLALIKMARV